MAICTGRGSFRNKRRRRASSRSLAWKRTSRLAIAKRAHASPGGKAYYHLVLLARDQVGYKNLCKLSSLAYTEGFYSRPRVDRELLAQYSEGLIVSSACLAGEVAAHLQTGDMNAAREAASWYANLFKDRYYLEVQAHDSQGQAQLNEQIFALGDELGLPVIATNDAHFLAQSDHARPRASSSVSGSARIATPPTACATTAGLYFKSAPRNGGALSQPPRRPHQYAQDRR